MNRAGKGPGVLLGYVYSGACGFRNLADGPHMVYVPVSAEYAPALEPRALCGIQHLSRVPARVDDVAFLCVFIHHDITVGAKHPDLEHLDIQLSQQTSSPEEVP